MDEFNINEQDRALAQPHFLFTLYQAKALIIFHYQGERNVKITNNTLLQFVREIIVCRYQHDTAI